MRTVRHSVALRSSLLATSLVACTPEPEPDVRAQDVTYREGTVEDDYTSSGERGQVQFTEVHWAGSVHDDGTYDPDDDFIELRNAHPRPIHMTGWVLTVTAGLNTDGIEVPDEHNIDERQYLIPLREGGLQVQPQEYVIIAAKRDGAFRQADYYLEGLRIPDGPFHLELADKDERLMDDAGDARKPPFAGCYDLVVARSMERVQLVFNNRGSRDYAWHTYSYNVFDAEPNLGYHTSLREFIDPDYRDKTYATPKHANSADYSGNVASGNVD